MNEYEKETCKKREYIDGGEGQIGVKKLVNIYWLEERTDKDRPQVEERE